MIFSIYFRLIGFIAIFLCLSNLTFGQSSCPVNIDFELGTFQNWQCYIGNVNDINNVNVINVTPSAPTTNRHVIVPKGTQTDPYGGFSISPPDGSAYCVKLGNDGTGAQAEQMSYTFTVPNQPDYVITYQYAVVLQDPGHPPADQPRFTAKVFDITANSYVTCGSFDYVATAGLPGFIHSKNYASNQVIYKGWTPVSINLNGYQGHQLRLEFTTADCTQGGHFGYAYVDVNNSCSQLITNNIFCTSRPTFTLNGPAGFSQYNWYNADRSKLLGTGVNLTLPTTTPDNTQLLLDLIPFVGFGCNYTVSTTLHSVSMKFRVTNPAQVCEPATIDITNPALTSGSDANLTYTYWQDAAGTIPLTSPQAVSTSGTYYIKASAAAVCFDIQPVNVTILKAPVLNITDPLTVCINTPVDITSAAITSGSSAGLTYTYWQDAAATQPLASPAAIITAGTYYIKATNSNGCVTIKPVNVTNYPVPVLIITNPFAVCFPSMVDITDPAITTGSDPGMVFTYWTDANATSPVPDATKVPQSGTYYIKAINSHGCEVIKPVTVTVNPLPKLVITNPELCFPGRADLTSGPVTSGSSNVAALSYWKDALATVPLVQPQAIADSGVYYIKATSSLGCEIIQPVLVTIHKLPVLNITNPVKVYIPATIDITSPGVTTGSTSGVTYSYWQDSTATSVLPNPSAITQTGLYYIKATNIYGCYTIKPVNVTVATIPNILVPKAFTPTQAENNRLYPFIVGIKSFKSFKIYNHWGVLIFQTDSASPENGWDGMYKGQIQFMDTVTWYAEGYDYAGNLVHKSGNTLLLK